jgi:hypothetical protein
MEGGVRRRRLERLSLAAGFRQARLRGALGNFREASLQEVNLDKSTGGAEDNR